MKIKIIILLILVFISGLSSAADTTKDVNVINTPNVKVVGKVQIDNEGQIGTGAVEPELEELKMKTILKPLINIMQIKADGLQLPPHTSICPAPSMSLFGRLITLDFQCKVVDNVGTFLTTVITFFYASIAFVIVIKA